jgi:glycine/D-amino acid oxidase-like deaminating enzyme
MSAILIIGAGITGGYTAVRLHDNGAAYIKKGDIESVASDRTKLNAEEVLR